MKFVQLSETEFQNFVNNHFSHYTQSSQHFCYRNKFQNDVHLVGVKDNEGTVIAACLLTEAQALKVFKYFYTHRGPVLDFKNFELVRFFYKNLTRYLKKNRGLFVLTDPYTLENIRNAQGEILTSYDNRPLIKTLKNIGYTHQGYSIGYSQTSQIRWLSVLDLNNKDTDMLLSEMDYQTRRNIKKTYEMNVQVRTLSIEETSRFFKLFKMAEEKHGFKFRNQDYFEKMQKIYNDNSMLKLAYINLSDLLEKQNNKITQLNKQYEEIISVLKENPNSKKNKNKANQINQQISAQNRKINETKELIKTDGKIIDLAAAFYIYNNDEVYYLSSGSNPKYNAYMGAYRLQWEMIKFAKQNNIPRYNFYGITGDFSETAEDYGVQRFKEGFNAYVEEYIGDFIKPLRPFIYKIYTLLKR
ncbi:endopeptidase Ale-1 resistance FemAB family serine transferase Epr [Staphylococcus warneri]|uniref:endopeptidase Ale-1 resistance FemAB family serine transferase Epr n=1 Tax=Staphylococcus warneri TaxID=1292 RepID=UPI002928D05A|nr:endopeptidase Ale-1 resistance FemAB family serine transferase Epr [Staphylococcus warneri]MDU9352991.1 endopeptidase Ale-1 resistance FemAB family serine transferase Epr [Staphylococcus warneri]